MCKNRQQIVDKILSINSVLTDEILKKPNNNPGLLVDLGGTCLFFFYYSKLFNNEEAYNKGNIILDRIISSIYFLNKDNRFTFCSGLAGIGWLINHLNQENFIELDEDVFSDLDRILEDYLTFELNKGNYDFLHGAMGVFNYFLTKNIELPILNNAVEILNRIKIEHEHGYYWQSYIVSENKFEINTANLGLSHGSPAIISILSKYYNITKNKSAKKLIENGSQFILMTQNPVSSESLYPYTYSTIKHYPSNSRLGWCYGDLGISLMLYNTGVILENKDYIDKSIYILNHTVKRKGTDISVFDGALCHGTSGIAQIYKKFYLDTNIPLFLQQHDYWIEATLKYLDNKSSIITAGTKWDTQKGYVNSFGLLDGISGVGLSLMSNICKGKLNWEEVLLIS